MDDEELRTRYAGLFERSIIILDNVSKNVALMRGNCEHISDKPHPEFLEDIIDDIYIKLDYLDFLIEKFRKTASDIYCEVKSDTPLSYNLMMKNMKIFDEYTTIVTDKLKSATKKSNVLVSYALSYDVNASFIYENGFGLN